MDRMAGWSDGGPEVTKTRMASRLDVGVRRDEPARVSVSGFARKEVLAIPKPGEVMALEVMDSLLAETESTLTSSTWVIGH